MSTHKGREIGKCLRNASAQGEYIQVCPLIIVHNTSSNGTTIAYSKEIYSNLHMMQMISYYS